MNHPATKTDFFKAFPQVSPTAIRKMDGEVMIVGRFCRIAYDGKGVFDLWLLNERDPVVGLSERKLTALLEDTLQHLDGLDVHRLDGEAWVKFTDRRVVTDNLKPLGIRRKKVVTPEQLARLAQVRVASNAP